MPATNGTMIRMENITKVFYTDEVETHALSGVQMEIRKGEYVSIAGPSGSGKSTLLALIGLLDSPSDGEYILNGQSVANLDISQRARIRNREIGFIFQSFNLIGDLNVYENVELPLTYPGKNTSERQKHTSNALERFGMTNPAARLLPKWHGDDQQQRSAVARRSAGAPTSLRENAPIGGLDSTSGRTLME